MARDREQLAEAYAVEVRMGDRSVGAPGERDEAASRVIAVVINHGRYTITGIDAQLRLSAGGNTSLVPFDKRNLMPALEGESAGLGWRLAKMHADRLTPWDLSLQFESDPIAAPHLPGAYPVVRWVDQWGTHWEHRRGEVAQIEDGEEWVP